MGGLGFIFGVSCRVGSGYWVRGSEPWAVRASKKSPRAISSPDLALRKILYDNSHGAVTRPRGNTAGL